MNSKEPLGLPRGSVRAIITLGLLMASVAMVFVPVNEKEYATGLFALAGVAIRDYFQTRKTQNDEDGPQLAEPVEG